jgi:hypothetical protein
MCYIDGQKTKYSSYALVARFVARTTPVCLVALLGYRGLQIDVLRANLSRGSHVSRPTAWLAMTVSPEQ